MEDRGRARPPSVRGRSHDGAGGLRVIFTETATSSRDFFLHNNWTWPIGNSPFKMKRRKMESDFVSMQISLCNFLLLMRDSQLSCTSGLQKAFSISRKESYPFLSSLFLAYKKVRTKSEEDQELWSPLVCSHMLALWPYPLRAGLITCQTCGSRYMARDPWLGGRGSPHL
ncbi:hypothetical protein J6590_072542 [Homalodisca vitripennis]|nr:hypothetical protein J6590_072542 [Homalodisca vitripennis]